MAKVLLVEDDNNLREIYEARLQAEGYDIASARDGEEALVVAKKEQPDLVISDVMMPKISGFEMLDILRNTEGLQAVKVIMLTALGQSEDQSRADSLGADRYLVKSQVTLEDIVNAAHDLLVEAGAVDAPAPVAASAPQPAPQPAPAPAPQQTFPQPSPVAAAPSTPAEDATPVIPLATAPPEFPETQPDIQMPGTDDSAAIDTTPVQADPVAPVSVPQDQPTDAPVTTLPGSNDDVQQTSEQETATVQSQIDDFVQTQSGQPEPQTEPQPDPAPEQYNQPEATAAPEPAPLEAPAPIPEPAPAVDIPTPQSPASSSQEQNQDEVLNDALEQLGSNGETASEATPAAPEKSHKLVIQPLSPTTQDSVSPEQRLQDLLAAEAAKEAAAFGSAPEPNTIINPSAEPTPLPPEFQPTPQPPMPQPAPQAAPSAPPIQPQPVQQPPAPSVPPAPAAAPTPAPQQQPPTTAPKPPANSGDFDPNSIAL